MTTLELFKDARKLLEKGWTQHRLYAEKDGVLCYCLGGAMRKAAAIPGDELTSDAYLYSAPEVLRDASYLLERTLGSGVAYWNDQPARTQEQVLAKVDSIIAALEAM